MMLLDYFGVFRWVFGKMDEINKIWANFEILCRGVGIPRSNVSPRQGVTCPHRGMAERRLGQASGTPRHSKATPRRRPTSQYSSAMLWRSTVHRMEIFVFCHVLLFHYSKD